ncbi:MAG TPA: hypothetical protein VF629_21040 [Hymenobacter sp.]|jgi:hypothetical protein|uniref:hypothetical protein n=1 Tax=Hymenobacter sp. TaxID=1898978 RepID=UPI002ED9DCCE
MQVRLLWLSGLSFIAIPLAAQTVVPGTISKPSSSASGVKNTGAEAALANKLQTVNEFGDNGFDLIAFDTRPRTVRGTPFVVPGWAMGEVRLGAKAKPMSGVLKFDVFNQQVRALRPQGDSIILAPGSILSFSLRPTGINGQPEERRFELLPPGAVTGVPVAFAEALSSGEELRLLKLPRKTIIKGNSDPSYSSSNPVDSYQNSAQYFLRWADGTVVSVKPTQASIVAAVALRQSAVAAAETKNKTKARSDAELAAVVQRMNEAMPRK